MWDALKALLGIKKDSEGRQDALAKMGIFIVGDGRMDERIKELTDFYIYRDNIVALKTAVETGTYTPEECLKSLIENMNLLNQQIDRIATPYWRALSRHESSIVMRAWSEINGYFFDMSHTLQNWFNRLSKNPNEIDNLNNLVKPRLPKSVLISAFLTMVIREYLPRAETLMRVSWADIDVIPSWAGSIQPMVQPYGYMGGYPPVRQFDTGSPFPRQGETEPGHEVYRRKKEGNA